MFGHVLKLVAEALKRVGLPVLITIAGKLSALTKTIVQPTVSSIMTGIRTFVGNNRAKLMIVLNVLATAGLMIDWDEDALEKLPPGTRNGILEFRDNLQASLEAHTGDGQPGSTHSLTADQAAAGIVAIQSAKEAVKVLKQAAVGVGSVKNVLALRRAMVMDETDVAAALELI